MPRKTSLARFSVVWGSLIVALCVLGAPLLPAQDFIRGDFNGDGSVEVSDAIAMLSHAFINGAGPSNSCAAGATLDQADVNDNEFFTIADPMRHLATLFGSEVMPAPNSCGADPTNTTDGFDVVDDDYRVSVLPGVGVPATNGAPRMVEYPIFINAPEDIIGLELYFAIDPALLSNPSYSGNPDLVFQQLLFNVVVLRLADPGTPVALAAGTQFLGTLTFELVPGVEVPELEFAADLFSTFQRRATLVTADFRDHHPAYVTQANAHFSRGDVNSDEAVDTSDFVAWLSHYYLDVEQAPSNCGPFRGEALDVNDNEFITPADFMALRSFLFCGTPNTIPAPFGGCGPDPTSSNGGFGSVDPNYRVVVSDIVLIGAGPAEREVTVTVKVQTPVDMSGFQLLLKLNDPDMVLDDPFFVPEIAFSDAIVSDARQDGDFVSVLAAQGCGSWISGNPGVLQTVGTLRFTLMDNEIEAPIEFVDRVRFGNFLHHNTIIDSNFGDHRPVTEAGDALFRRGLINNDSAVGLGDVIFLLNFLFQSGAVPPCLDAADLDNDGLLTLLDALRVLNYLFLMGPTLPDPFEECGRDNDIDELECDTPPMICAP